MVPVTITDNSSSVMPCVAVVFGCAVGIIVTRRWSARLCRGLCSVVYISFARPSDPVDVFDSLSA